MMVHMQQGEEFKQKEKIRKHNWYERTKEEFRELKKIYRKTHIMEERKRVRFWRKNNPDKIRKINQRRRVRKLGAAGSHTDKEWVNLKTLTGNQCLGCGAKGIELTEDHIIPLSKGGTDYIDNIQPLCLPCNSRKHNTYDILLLCQL